MLESFSYDTHDEKILLDKTTVLCFKLQLGNISIDPKPKSSYIRPKLSEVPVNFKSLVLVAGLPTAYNISEIVQYVLTRKKQPSLN